MQGIPMQGILMQGIPMQGILMPAMVGANSRKRFFWPC
jgi:hypothetical protein